jgi:DICT domain-containing protein
MAREWVVIAISPRNAAAFVARDCGDTGPDPTRRFDFIYTHDRSLVVAAARSFLRELLPMPVPALTLPAAPLEETPAPIEPAVAKRSRIGLRTLG